MVDITLTPPGELPLAATMSDDDSAIVSVGGVSRRVSKATFSNYLNLPTGFDPRVFVDYDASTGVFPSDALRGDGYTVTTAGTIDGISFAIGDYFVAKIDGPSTTTYAGNWEKYASPNGLNQLRSDVDALENLTFPTITAMQAAPALADDTVVTVAGRPYLRDEAATDVVGTNNNFHDLGKRSEATFNYYVSLGNDTKFEADGLKYVVDTSVPLSASAGADLSVAGVKPDLSMGRASVSAFGVKQDGVSDDTAALLRAVESGIPIVSDGPIRITGTVSHSGGVDWLFKDGSKIIVDAGSYPSGFAIEFKGSISQVEDLGAAASRGDYNLSAASVSSFVSGDIGMIYNPTGGSWSGFRTSYRAGELFRVSGVSGAAITLAKRLYDGYAIADVDVYKVSPIKVNLDGMKVESTGQSSGLVLVQYADTAVVRGADIYNENNSCLVLDKCMGYEVHDPKIVNLGDGGDDYGIVAQSSQHGRIWGGYGYGRRHPFTTGQDNQIGSIPCRDCLWIGGTLENDIESEVPAADLHGGSEFCGFEQCHISGGFDLSGSNNWIKGGYCSSMKNGVLGFVNEALGGKYVVDGVHFDSFADPGVAASRGAITIGAQSNQITVNTARDLTLQVTNCQFVSSAWGAGVTIVYLANRGTAKKLNVDCRGNVFEVSDFGQAVRIELVSGSASSDFIICDDNKTAITGKFSVFPDGDYANLPVLRCQSDTWSETVITASALSKIGANLHSYKWRFPRNPQVFSSMNRTVDFTSGSVADVTAVEDVATHHARLFVSTGDGSNYPNNTDTKTIVGRAEIREV